MVIEELSNQLFMIIEVSVVEREKNNYGKQEKKIYLIYLHGKF